MNFFNFKPEHYIVYENTDVIYGLIQSEFEKKLLKKKYNLSGKISKDGGLDLFPTVVFANFQPNLGPVAGINLSGLSVSRDGQKSKITVNRINGLTYKFHLGFAISLAIIIVLILIFQFSSEHTDKNLNLLFLPIFPLIYAVIIESFADIVTYNLKKRIESILGQNKITFKKQ